MGSLQRTTENSSTKLMAMASLAAALVIGFCFLGTPSAYANHPVLVEGNCDSPVPGTTLVSPGTCGDFDGDGRIGTAEDTDGADRIFGTLSAAIGPGTGAAAGTGANFNGLVIIVTSGRFAEQLSIPLLGGGNGNLQIEAAPGVVADIDAVLQGDPAAGNNTRQEAVGLTINVPQDRKVVLRNLTFRNWAEGVRAVGNSRVFIDNCKFENNRDFAIRVTEVARLAVYQSAISDTGFRVGTANNSPNPGNAIQFEGNSRGSVTKSSITGSFNLAINNQTTNPITYYEVVTFDNLSGSPFGLSSPPFAGPVTRVDF